MPTLDFGFNANPTDSGTEPVTDLDTGVTGTVSSDGNIIPPIDEPNNDGQDNNGKTDGDGKKMTLIILLLMQMIKIVMMMVIKVMIII